MTLLITWSIQALALTAAGALVALTLANANARLIFWQGLLLALLVLPAVEPWQIRPVVVVKAAPMPIPDSQAAAEAQSGPGWQPQWWVLLIAAGAAVRVLWIGAGFLRLRNFRRKATPLTESPFPFTSSAARWYISEIVPGPVTYGWLRPSILLPARVMRLPAPFREAIACHELTHVRRRDWLFVLAEEAVRSALWFHPAVWYILSRIQLAREQVVDHEVVRLTEDRECYLEALIEVAAQKLRPDLAPAPLFLRKRHLASRVAAVLKEVSMSTPRIAARLTAAFSAMVLAACVAVLFVPFVSPAQTVMDDPGITVDPGGTLLHRAAIHNPSAASGTVTIEASLSAKGEVTDAHVLAGPEELRREALSSVLQWHYSPGLSRVQASLHFDAPAAAPRATQVRSALPPLPPPIGSATVVRGIDFLGFSPEAEQDLRNRLPIHVGDNVTPEVRARVTAAVTEFDSHAVATFSQRPGPEGAPVLTLRLSVAPAALAVATQSQPRAIGSDVMAANKIQNATPVYPPLAKSARIQGVVKFVLTIGADGAVRDAQFVSGHPLLVQAAKDAVMQWVYKPTLLNGEPVEVQTTVDINFTLAQ
jgi:TonB family protein